MKMDEYDELNEFNHGLLHKAVIHNKTEHFFNLIKEGYNLNQKDELGFSPIHLACLLGRDEILYQILKLKDKSRANFNHKMPSEICVNALSNEGQTALHLASKTGNSEILSLLLSIGCNKEIIDANGKTALDLARKFNHHHCANILEGEKNVDKDVNKSIIVRNPYRQMKKQLIKIKRRLMSKSLPYSSVQNYVKHEDRTKYNDMPLKKPNEFDIVDRAEISSIDEHESRNQSLPKEIAEDTRPMSPFINVEELRTEESRLINTAYDDQISSSIGDTLEDRELLAKPKTICREIEDVLSETNEENLVTNCECYFTDSEKCNLGSNGKQAYSEPRLDKQIMGSINRKSTCLHRSHSLTCIKHFHTLNKEYLSRLSFLHINDQKSTSSLFESKESLNGCELCIHKEKKRTFEKADKSSANGNCTLHWSSNFDLCGNESERKRCIHHLEHFDGEIVEVMQDFYSNNVDNLIAETENSEEIFRPPEFNNCLNFNLGKSSNLINLGKSSNFIITSHCDLSEKDSNENKQIDFQSKMGLNPSSHLKSKEEAECHNESWEVWDLKKAEARCSCLKSPRKELIYEERSRSVPHLVCKLKCSTYNGHETFDRLCKTSSLPINSSCIKNLSVHATNETKSNVLNDWIFTDVRRLEHRPKCIINEEMIDVDIFSLPSSQVCLDLSDYDGSSERFQTDDSYNLSLANASMPILSCDSIYRTHSDSDLLKFRYRKQCNYQSKFSRKFSTHDSFQCVDNFESFPLFSSESNSLALPRCYDWSPKNKNHLPFHYQFYHGSTDDVSTFLHRPIKSDCEDLRRLFTCLNCGSALPRISIHELRRLGSIEDVNDEFLLISCPKGLNSTITNKEHVKGNDEASSFFNSNSIAQRKYDCFGASTDCICQNKNNNKRTSALESQDKSDICSIEKVYRDATGSKDHGKCQSIKQKANAENGETFLVSSHSEYKKDQSNCMDLLIHHNHQTFKEEDDEDMGKEEKILFDQSENMANVSKSSMILDSFEIESKGEVLQNALEISTPIHREKMIQRIHSQCHEMPRTANKLFSEKTNDLEINNDLDEICLSKIDSNDDASRIEDPWNVNTTDPHNDNAQTSAEYDKQEKCKWECAKGKPKTKHMNRESDMPSLTNNKPNHVFSRNIPNEASTSHCILNLNNVTLNVDTKDLLDSMQDNIDLISNDTGIEMENDDLSIIDFDDFNYVLESNVFSNEDGRCTLPEQTDVFDINRNGISAMSNTVMVGNIDFNTSRMYEVGSNDHITQTLRPCNSTSFVVEVNQSNQRQLETQASDIFNQKMNIGFSHVNSFAIQSDTCIKNSQITSNPKIDSNNNNNAIHSFKSTTISNEKFVNMNNESLMSLLAFSRNIRKESKPSVEKISLFVNEFEAKMLVGICFINFNLNVDNMLSLKHEADENVFREQETTFLTFIVNKGKGSNKRAKSHHPGKDKKFQISSCIAFYGLKPVELKEYWFLKDPRIVALLIVNISESDQLEYCRKEIGDFICEKVIKECLCSFDLVINWILVLLGLIKDENGIEKSQTDMSSVLPMLDYMIRKSYFKLAHARQLAFFLARKNDMLKSHREYRINFLLTFFKLELKDSPFSCKYPLKIFSKVQKLFMNVDDDLRIAHEVLDQFLSIYLHQNNCLNFISDVLIYTGLLKSEFPVDITDDLKTCLLLLKHIVIQSYFPSKCVPILKAFIQMSHDSFAEFDKEKSELLYILEHLDINI